MGDIPLPIPDTVAEPGVISASTTLCSPVIIAQMTRIAFLTALLTIAASTASGEIVDRIAAIVSSRAITTSEVTQNEILRIFPRQADETSVAHRSRILHFLINQALQHDDMERFGAEEVLETAVESRFELVKSRFASEEEFSDALESAELSPDELREMLEHQLEVERYIDERFSPLIYVSIEEIETHYRDVWVPSRRSEGVSPRPLSAVRDEIRGILKRGRLQEEVELWTRELRNRSNVDVYGAQ